MLKPMHDNIPKEHYKPLYYALFESNITYCITDLEQLARHSVKRYLKSKSTVYEYYLRSRKNLNKFKTSQCPTEDSASVWPSIDFLPSASARRPIPRLASTPV